MLEHSQVQSSDKLGFKLIKDKLDFNQSILVEGLRESVAIAIHLNRTLVIPPMYRHFTDPDGPNGVVDR